MTFKRIVALVLTVMALATLTTVSATAEPTVIQYWFQGTNQTSTEFAQMCVDKFNASQSDIVVEMTGMSNTISDQETKLNAAVLSDTYPDVIDLVLAQIGSRASLGELEALQPYIDQWDEKDNVYDSAYNMGKYQGETVAIGFYPNPQVYVYRKDKFEEAGITTIPSTWAELKEVAEALTVRDGDRVVFAGFDIPAVDSSLVFTEPFMRSAGSAVIDEQNLVPSLTDEGAIRALTFIQEMCEANISIPFDQQNSDQVPFMSGNSAICNLGTSQILNFKATYPDAEIGYLPVLSEDGSVPGTSFCGYQLIAIGASSKHKEAAWEFVKFMLSDEIVWDRYEAKGVPVMKKTLEEKYVTSGDQEMNEAVLTYVQAGKGKATVPWISVFNKYASVAYEEIINLKKTPEEALTDAQNALLNEIE